MNSSLKSLHEQIVSQLDIVEEVSKYITLSKKGQSYVCLCPFHDDSSPSMNVSSSKQIFKCFACGVGGDVVSFVSRFKKTSYVDTLKQLALEHNIEVSSNLFYEPKSKYTEQDLAVLDLLEKVNSFYKLEFKRLKNTELNEFFTSRKLDNDLINDFDIGYASGENFLNFFKSELEANPFLFVKAGLINPENKLALFYNRVIFGIRNSEGKIVGFSARALQKDIKPKYVNSAESNLFQKSELLYNFYRTKSHFDQNSLIIVEGFFDVIALHKIGIYNSVALMGTALTTKHLRLLNNKQITIFLDGDQAGQNASLKNAKFLIEHGYDVKIVVNKTRLDPDEIIIQYGPQYLNDLLKQAPNALDFIYDYFKTQFNLVAGQNNNLNSIQNFISSFEPYLKGVKQNIAHFYASRIKNDFNFEVNFDANINSDSDEYSLPNEYDFVDTGEFLAHDFVPDYVPQSDIKDSFDPNTYTLVNKSLQSNKKITLGWVDRLFYVLLEHPNLISLFLERESKDIMNLRVFDDYKQDIYEQLKSGQMNAEQLQDSKNKLTHNNEYLEEYEQFMNDFTQNKADLHNLQINLDLLYTNALRECDDKYIETTKNPKLIQTISANAEMFEEHTQTMLRINRRKK
ncbi:DNA primase [Mycoplasma simbae]|uniref:DNA primase n=1 Tax=Mycoplasma simbae TaxID=36744 RepID=UPI0004964AF3|nr:DNA primase [Mycoplasma simbae]